MGMDRPRPVVALREAIELIRLLWAGGAVEYEGQLVRFTRGALEFKIRQGIPIVVAVGGPSSLAIDVAREFNVTLIGFARGDTFNVYAGAERLFTGS